MAHSFYGVTAYSASINEIVKGMISLGLNSSNLNIWTHDPSSMWIISFHEPESGNARHLCVFPEGSCNCDCSDVTSADGTFITLDSNDFSRSFIPQLIEKLSHGFVWAIKDESREDEWKIVNSH